MNTPSSPASDAARRAAESSEIFTGLAGGAAINSMMNSFDQKIAAAWQEICRADENNRLRVGDAALGVLKICHMIERLPASHEQTELSLACATLYQRMQRAGMPAHGDGTGELLYEVQFESETHPQWVVRVHHGPYVSYHYTKENADQVRDMLNGARQQLAAATARADALAADKQRLDWLEGEDFLEDAHDHPFYKRQRLVGALLDDGATSVRAAIDAAMGEKPGQGRHLRYDLYTAPDNGEHRHPQAVMKSLGITYAHAVPQSLGDQWWFLDCENIPAALPPHITPMTLTDEEYRHWAAP